MSNLIFSYALVLASITGFSQGLKIFYPSSSGQLIEKTYYSLDYNEEREQPNWVIYSINPVGDQRRNDNFKSDPEVTTGSASLSDYSRSGYDRGHLAPAGDMTISREAMDESFFMSNMSPQNPGFNRGVWKKLESLMRNWAINYNTTNDFVVVGPIFQDGKNCGEIGISVDVPCYYYRIYMNISEGKAIGFILPNESSKRNLTDYVVSIDSIESLTSIDFFHSLHDELENKLESQDNTSNWSWDTSTVKRKSKNISSTSVQCHGIAKSTGERCKLKTRNENKYCHHHQSQVGDNSSEGNEIKNSKVSDGRCQAKTQKGTQCKRSTQDGSKYCWQH